MSTGKHFTEEEIELIVAEIQKTKGVLSNKRAEELAGITGRTVGAIRSKFGRLKKLQGFIHNKGVAGPLNAKYDPQSSVREKGVAWVLVDLAHQLYQLSETIREVAVEAGIRDKWIEDTLSLKRDFQYRVDGQGLVT